MCRPGGFWLETGREAVPGVIERYACLAETRDTVKAPPSKVPSKLGSHAAAKGIADERIAIVEREAAWQREGLSRQLEEARGALHVAAANLVAEQSAVFSLRGMLLVADADVAKAKMKATQDIMRNTTLNQAEKPALIRRVQAVSADTDLGNGAKVRQMQRPRRDQHLPPIR